MSVANDAPPDLAAAWSCQSGLLSDLLLRCGHGDQEAFARLLDLIYPIIHAAAGRVTSPPSDGLIRDTFVSLWRNAPTYRPGELSAVAWIMQIAGRA